MDTQTGLKIAKGDELLHRGTVFVPNDFPYDLPYGTEHFLAWSLDKRTSKGEIEEQVRKRWPDRDVCAFENPPMFKTIPEIEHWHILVRKGSNTQRTIIFPDEIH